MDSSNSSSSSSSAVKDLVSPISLLSNICNLISIRLDSTNFVVWKFQLTALLKAHKLFGFVDGTQPCPDSNMPSSTSTDPPPQSSNSSYDDWIAKDQALMTVINATLSPEALAYVVGSTSSKQVWDLVAKLYCSNSRSNVVNLKSDLQSISKKSDESIDAYIKRIKEIKDKLANVSTAVNEEDLIIYALNGLPSEFNTFRTSMRTRSQPVTFEELHDLLRSEESALAKQSSKREDLLNRPNDLLDSSQSQSLYSCASTDFNRNSVPGHAHQLSRGSAAPLNHTSSCQICSRRGHIAIDCFNRMNYNFQGRIPPHQLAAMVASHNNAFLSVVNSSSPLWLSDSSSTNNSHITSDLNYVSIASEFNGEQQVGVGVGVSVTVAGSGQSLPISHTGCSTFDFFFFFFYLSVRLLKIFLIL